MVVVAVEVVVVVLVVLIVMKAVVITNALVIMVAVVEDIKYSMAFVVFVVAVKRVIVVAMVRCAV